MDINKIVMVFLFALGVTLASLAAKIDSVTSLCVNNAVKASNRGILVISVLFMVIPVMYLIVLQRCNCTTTKISSLLYNVMFLALGITLISLGSIISIQAGKNAACKNAKKYATGVWVIGLLATLGSTGSLVYVYKEKIETQARSIKTKLF